MADPYSGGTFRALSPEAFSALVERTSRGLHSFLRGMAGNAEQARDLTQDTYHDAWRAAQRGDAPFLTGTPEEQMRRWLYRTAYRRAVSALRHSRLIRWETLDLASERESNAAVGDISFENQLAESEAVREALAALSPQDSACLLLRVVQGFSAAEVAQIVDATPDVVTKRLSRAKQRLRAVYVAQNQQAHAKERTRL